MYISATSGRARRDAQSGGFAEGKLQMFHTNVKLLKKSIRRGLISGDWSRSREMPIQSCVLKLPLFICNVVVSQNRGTPI